MKSGGAKPNPQVGGGLSQAGGSLSEELIKRPLKDIAKGLMSFFDIGALLGSKPADESPEDKVKKKQIHSRFEQLTQEEQAYVQQKYSQE